MANQARLTSTRKFFAGYCSYCVWGGDPQLIRKPANLLPDNRELPVVCLFVMFIFHSSYPNQMFQTTNFGDYRLLLWYNMVTPVIKPQDVPHDRIRNWYDYTYDQSDLL
jgi:hypothetical protein